MPLGVDIEPAYLEEMDRIVMRLHSPDFGSPDKLSLNLEAMRVDEMHRRQMLIGDEG